MHPEITSAPSAAHDAPVFAPASARDAASLGLRARCVALASGPCTYIDEGRGPVLLLLHGAPLTSLAFMRVVRALRGRYRVVVPDLPGFGASPASAEFSGTLEAYAQFVQCFMERLDLREAVVFVHDSSASFGLSALSRVPERVAGVVVADTVSLPLTGLAAPVRWMLARVMGSQLVRAINRRFNVLAWMVACVAPWLRPFARVERRTLVAQFDTGEKRDRALALLEQMGRDRAFMQETPRRVRESLSGHPALLLYGQFDPMRFVGAIGCFRRLMPRSRVAIIPWEEHFPILASGDRVAATIDAWVRANLPGLARGRAS